MSYCIFDNTGYVDEFGGARSIQVLSSAKDCPESFQKFLRTEEATESEVTQIIKDLQAVPASSKNNDEYTYAIEVLTKTKGDVRLDDGCNDT